MQINNNKKTEAIMFQKILSLSETMLKFAISLILFMLVQQIMPLPYMDEPFHIPQAKRYCEWEFSWDPKITTPPGLYYLSLALSPLQGCSILSLRLTNVILGGFKLYLLKVLNVEWLYLMPISFFYHHLYYTDTLSELLMLLSYYGVIKQSRLLVFLFGIASIFIRQTNIVLLIWMIFYNIYKRNSHQLMEFSIPVQHLTVKSTKKIIYGFISIVFSNGALDLLLLISSMIYIGYLVFKYGIVQGDNNNHVFSLHFPQFLYFNLTLFGLYLPSTLPNFSLKSILVLSVIVFPIIHYFTLHHPFILSDNRHLTFYFWKLLYKNLNVYKELLYSIVYSITLLSTYNTLKHYPLIPVVGYVLSLCLILIPSPLFEFRYFIFHLTIYGIEFHNPTTLNKLVYVLLNSFVFILFLCHPAHIMW